MMPRMTMAGVSRTARPVFVVTVRLSMRRSVALDLMHFVADGTAVAMVMPVAAMMNIAFDRDRPDATGRKQTNASEQQQQSGILCHCSRS